MTLAVGELNHSLTNSVNPDHMRGSRKFCQRGSNLTGFFWGVGGGGGGVVFFWMRGKRIQIALKKRPSSVRQRNTI